MIFGFNRKRKCHDCKKRKLLKGSQKVFVNGKTVFICLECRRKQ